MSNIKPEQETVMPPYPLGAPPTKPTHPAQVETAEEAGAGKSDKELDPDDEPGPAAEQRPPSDS
jgi:hypothetical protein